MSFESLTISEIYESFHLSEYIKKKLDINITVYIYEYKVMYIVNYVDICVFYQRIYVHIPRNTLTFLATSFIREKLIVDTINLLAHAVTNDVVKDIFSDYRIAFENCLLLTPTYKNYKKTF
ncbi:hypothetical protein CDIK_1164 [Cucumispora dikerogammari]|nr:hypothetical protein CDIK_1164 [Cucumispora dikerogammari]